MRLRHIVITILGFAIMGFGSVPGSTGTLRNSRGRVVPQAVHGTAFAALEPVGAAAGWGRVTVRDDDLPGGLHRTVGVWLFGMKPRTVYSIEIDGIEIGVVLTRPSGSGVLKLQNRGGGHDSAPDDLPSVDLLETAVVFGPGGDLTLEGQFSSFTQSEGDTTYEEEIVLEDVTGGDATGMAKVEMEEDGHQEFKTRASGLVPGKTYSVRVDGAVVASVTADEQGQARVQFEEPDDDNPLPQNIPLVSEIVTVEWLDSDGEPLLYGTFNGVGACEKLMGTVTAVYADSFTIETDKDSVDVMTTETTEWEDFGDHALSIGDSVKVEGCWDGGVFVAREVELKGDGWQESCAKLVGVIGNVSGENFILDAGEVSIPVVTTADTMWDDFGDHELAVGDSVKVEGCWDGDVFVAHEVELLDDDEEEACTKYVGNVTAGDSGEFTLGMGARSIPVVTTADTEWLEFDGHVIGVGDKVKVEGCWESDVFMANKVELKKPA